MVHRVCVGLIKSAQLLRSTQLQVLIIYELLNHTVVNMAGNDAVVKYACVICGEFIRYQKGKGQGTKGNSVVGVRERQW